MEVKQILQLQDSTQIMMKQIKQISSSISPTAVNFVEQFCALLQSSINGDFLQNQIQPKTLFPWHFDIKHNTASPFCNKFINELPGKTAFTCFDCRQDDKSILCYQCFSQSNHEGHRYIEELAEDGTCDCGDVTAWSEQGFCKHHGSQTKIQIHQELQTLFCAQIKLSFFLYFWLHQKNSPILKIDILTQGYSIILFQYLEQLIQRDYQFKYLLSIVMQADLSEFQSIKNNHLKIIERFFRAQNEVEVSFIKIASKMSSVEYFRENYVKQLFEKSYRHEIPYEHPFNEMTFLYLGRPKMIAELIEKGKLQPMLLDPSKKIETPELVISLYKRYIAEFFYFIDNRNTLAYFKIHFERVNVCDMFSYRKYTQIIAASQHSGQMGILDNYFLKIFAEMLRSIKHLKYLLKKIMKELINFIIQNQTLTVSLIHQRAFAMTVITYLDGPLCQIQNASIKKDILQVLDQQENSDRANDHLEILTIRFLKGVIQSDILIEKQPLMDDIIFRSFQLRFPQRFLVESLNITYFKILVRLSSKRLNLKMIVEKVIEQMHAVDNPIILCYLFDYITQFMTMEIDQAIVLNMVGINCQSMIFSVFKRFLRSYPTRTAKEFKQDAKKIINNERYIEEFLLRQVKVQKDRIIQNNQQNPLQNFIFQQYLRTIRIDASKAVPAYFKIIPKTEYFKGMEILSQRTAAIVAAVLQNYLNQQVFEGAQQFLLSISKIYAGSTAQGLDKIRYYMNSGLKKINKVVSKQAFDQIIIIFNQEQKYQTIDAQSRQKQQKNALKRKENLLKKRRQKEQIMKIQQKQLLKSYQRLPQDLSIIETCVYCKQNNNIKLFFIAYCNFTTIYEHRCLKIQEKHVFFQTCGHKIHKQCYLQYLKKFQQLNRCFLCKRYTNILVPVYEAQRTNQEEIRVYLQFLQIIFPTLLRVNSDEEQIIESFCQQKYNFSYVSILIQSFVREVILRSMYDLETFEKALFPIYLSIFYLLQNLQELYFLAAINDVRNNVQSIESESQFKQLQLIVLSLISSALLKNVEESNYEIYGFQSERRFFKDIIDSFFNKKFIPPSNPPIYLTQKYPIINVLPKRLDELLPTNPQCQNCGTISNRLILCLLCSQISCSKCFNQIKNHIKAHIDGTIFLFLLDGLIMYCFRNQPNKSEFIYKNFLGEAIIDKYKLLIRQQVAKYQLSKDTFLGLQKKVVGHAIHDFTLQ